MKKYILTTKRNTEVMFVVLGSGLMEISATYGRTTTHSTDNARNIWNRYVIGGLKGWKEVK